MYVPRIVDEELDDLLPHLAAINLDGAKGVGKTATATRRAKSVLELDNAVDRQLILRTQICSRDRRAPCLSMNGNDSRRHGTWFAEPWTTMRRVGNFC